MPNALTSRLAIMYGMPEFSADPEAYIGEIERITKDYFPNELHRAADVIVRDHRPTRFKPWPSPSEILQACNDAREHLQPEVKEAWRYPEWTPDAVGKAYKLIRSEMGSRAADEGWIHPLWDFCRKHGELPTTPAEIARLKADAKEGEEAFEAVRNGDRTPVTGALLRLGDMLADRRERLKRHAWGEDVPKHELRIQDPEPQARGKMASVGADA